MKVFKSLALEIGGAPKEISFGLADTVKEREEVFALRYRVYTRYQYLIEGVHSNGLESDRYDEEGKSTYVIARVNDKIIGTVRMIFPPDLPIKSFFSFEVPQIEMEEGIEKGCEVSRLVVERYSPTEYLPRNVVMLFLMSTLLDHAKEREYTFAYGFLKERLMGKLNKLRVPFTDIQEFKVTYPPSGPMAPYFSDPSDRVIPSYFESHRLNKFMDETLGGNLFEKITEKEYALKHTLYTRFLTALKIL